MQRTSFLYPDGGDSHATLFIAAVAVSVVLHIALGWFARNAELTLPGFSGALTVDQQLALRRDSAVRLHRADGTAPTATEEAPDSETRERGSMNKTVEELLEVVDTDSPSSLFAPPPLSDSSGFGPLSPAPPAAADIEPPHIDWQPREEIMEISSRFANDDVAAIERLVVPDIDRVVGAPDVTADTTVSAVMEAVAKGGNDWSKVAWHPAPPPRGDVQMPEALANAGSIASAPDPEPLETLDGNGTPVQPEAFFAEIPEEVAPAKPIEDVLDAQVAVYRPKRDDGFVYFEVVVTRRGEDVLPPIPRDIIFAQDASRSISPQRLGACREALKRSFSYLKEGDRFEVTAFNTTNQWAFGRSWRPVSAEEAKNAEAFADALRPSGNTDIYSAMRSILSLPRSRDRATIAVLVSDGRATQGDIRRDSEIIGEFSRLNGGGVSVFSVGVSPESDEYLLSMLSFCNRGGPAALPESRFSIPKAMTTTVSSVGSPVLTDLKFVFDTSSGAVVAPKMTENLYLDKPLRLFGRVPAGTSDIVFQARGNNAGKAYDMVFDLSLGAPKPGDGDSAIAENWARTRVYDLVADNIRTGDPAAIVEMQRVGRAHGIPIPFGNRLGR